MASNRRMRSPSFFLCDILTTSLLIPKLTINVRGVNMPIMFVCEGCGTSVAGSLKGDGMYALPVTWILIRYGTQQWICCGKTCFDIVWARRDGKKLHVLEVNE